MCWKTLIDRFKLSRLKSVANIRIQKWMLDQLKAKGEPEIVLEEILERAGFQYVDPPK